MKFKRGIALLLSAVLIVTSIPAVRAWASPGEEPEEDAALLYSDDAVSYSRYIAEHGGNRDLHPDASIRISAGDFVSEQSPGGYIAPFLGEDGCLRWEERGSAFTWEFDVEETGWYRLAVTFCSLPGKNDNINLDVLLDGAIPFSGAENVRLYRQYLDATYLSMEDNDFEVNLKGDELRPSLTEQTAWQTQTVRDSKNQYPGALEFYLDAGRHTVTLRLRESALVIRSLEFCNPEIPEDYEQVKAQWDEAGAKDTSGYLGEYEAEKSYLKNALTMFATYDTAQSHVTPASPSVIHYNTIGKNTWKEAGQEITWEFQVPEDGYYYLAFKVKQRDKTNAYSTRSVTVDGQTVFTEMQEQKFTYQSDWYVQNLQDAEGTPLKVYLTAGRHVLGMKAEIDQEFAEFLRDFDETVSDLSGWYREIIKITGFNADSSRISIDMNRDFNLEKNIPGLVEGLQSCHDRLLESYARLENLDGISTSSASTIQETANILKKMTQRPGKITKYLETFRSDISNLSTWAIDMRVQPLTMDKFFVYSPDVETPEVGGGGFQQMWYRFRMFLNSFSDSATSVTGSTQVEDGDVTLRVWISTADITTTGASSGRDQAIILKKMIDESFTAKTGIRVDVSLVGGSDTLVQAVLAGEGPDAALFTSVDTPVNLAMRGVLLDLSQFEGFGEVCQEFTPSAMTPFRYKDGCYAFPETQNFNLIFYRADIFRELGLEPPDTWEEFYEQIVRLSNENYMVGVPQNQNTFETFLYQEGMTFYTEDLSRSTFDTNEALTAFGKWTDLYNKYSLSLIFDFFNRFRSGEMAMAIMPYNQVNYLYSAAPELDGSWDMAPVPGTMDENGNINRAVTSTSTGCIGLKDTEHPQEVYEFLRWWVSEETQANFGIQVEQTLGIAARYGTANLGAFEQLPWDSHQADVLRTQRANTVAVEQIPGSYYIERNLAFAFRAVVYNHANLRETLYKYNIEINKELERKQKEFEY